MSKYDIIYQNEVIGRINKNLVKQQDITDVTLEKIKLKHGVKRFFLNWLATINVADEPQTTKTLLDCITDIEYSLQDLWGFPKNSNYHKFWDLPQCKCPKMDNEDRYPGGYYVINGSCPLHGVV